LTRFLGACISDAVKADKALQEMNAALKAQNLYTDDLSDSLSEYATRMQNMIGISDEAVKTNIAIITGLTELSADAIPKASDAIIQIATLYRVDYNSAAILLGKTLTSNINAFARYGIQVDLSKDAMERLNEIYIKTSHGMDIAKEAADSMSGQIAIQREKIGDLREEMGARYLPTVTRWGDVQIQILNLLTGKWEDFFAVFDKGWLGYMGFLQMSMPGGASASFGGMEPRSFSPENVITGALGIGGYSPGMLWQWLNKPTFKYPGGASTGGGKGIPKGTREDPLWVNTSDLGPGPPARISGRFIGGRYIPFSPTGHIEALREGIGQIIQIIMDAAQQAYGPARAAYMGEQVFFPFRARGIAQQVQANRRAIAASLTGGQMVPRGTPYGSFRDINWEMAMAAGISGAGQGGAMGALGGMLPIIGYGLGGPIGGALGGLLGGILGKPRQRGDTATQPVYVELVNPGDIATALLNITKQQLAAGAAIGINSITMQLRLQAQRLGV